MLNSDSAKAKGDDLIKFICDNSAGKCVLKCSECGYEIEGKWVTGRASDGMGICPTCGSNKWE